MRFHVCTATFDLCEHPSTAVAGVVALPLPWAAARHLFLAGRLVGLRGGLGRRDVWVRDPVGGASWMMVVVVVGMVGMVGRWVWVEHISAISHGNAATIGATPTRSRAGDGWAGRNGGVVAMVWV